MPYSISSAAFLAVAGVAARGQLAQHRPVTQEEVRSEQRHPARIHLGPQVFGGELAFDGVLAARQPVHRGVDLLSVVAPATSRSTPRGAMGPPSPGLDSLLAGRTTRETISASTRSRARHDGPSRPGKPSWCAIAAATAATCPCGSEQGDGAQRVLGGHRAPDP